MIHRKAGMLVGLCGGWLALFAAPANAKPNFDNVWYVSITTKMGACESVSHYPVHISNGTPSGNYMGLTAAGRVSPKGRLTVVVTHDEKSAAGLGRLSKTTGGGKWSSDSCAGTWSAIRL